MYKVLDLFSGIGGFSLGLERAGMKTVAFCEINSFCQKVLKMHWPDIPVYADITTLTKDKLKNDGICTESIDVITSGDPCQRDSRANQNRDGKSMWQHTFRLIKEFKPIFVIRENVSGNIETGTLKRVECDLRSEGYQVRSYLIPAMSAGAAHNRPRTWTLAYSNSARSQKRNNAAEPSQTKRWQHSMHAGSHGVYWVGTQPPVLRRADDVPNRVDRIRALGNSVVPQIVEIIGRAIMQIENDH